MYFELCSHSCSIDQNLFTFAYIAAREAGKSQLCSHWGSITHFFFLQLSKHNLLSHYEEPVCPFEWIKWSPSHLWNFLNSMYFSFCSSLCSRGAQYNPIPSIAPEDNCQLQPFLPPPLPSLEGSGPKFLLTVACFHKPSLFPILVSHLQVPSSFAHFSFSGVIDHSMEHSFSVLHRTDGQKAVCLMSFWWAHCLLQPLSAASFLRGTDWRTYARACIPSDMLPEQKYTWNEE